MAGTVRDTLIQRGYVPTDDPERSRRSLAIGMSGRWITVYDSSDNVSGDQEPFRELSVELSNSFPTVDIEVSDDTVIELVLKKFDGGVGKNG